MTSPAAKSLAETALVYGLEAEEYDLIVRRLNREPNPLELGVFSVMWSEHCSYKSSRRHLAKLPTTGPRVIQGPGENAGAVDIGDGQAADVPGQILAGADAGSVVGGEAGDAGGAVAVPHRVGGDELGVAGAGRLEGRGDPAVGGRRAGQGEREDGAGRGEGEFHIEKPSKGGSRAGQSGT